MDIFPERLPLRGEAIEKRSSETEPPLPGRGGSAQPQTETARAGKRQPLSALCRGGALLRPRVPICVGRTGGAEPRPYKVPRKKATSIRISAVPSIDSSRSKATSIKSDTPVSGGAYQDARKVTIRVERRLKNRASPEFRGRMHPVPLSALFSPIFSRAREKIGAAGGASEMTTTERAAASDVSYPLCSFLPFQTAN